MQTSFLNVRANQQKVNGSVMATMTAGEVEHVSTLHCPSPCFDCIDAACFHRPKLVHGQVHVAFMEKGRSADSGKTLPLPCVPALRSCPGTLPLPCVSPLRSCSQALPLPCASAVLVPSDTAFCVSPLYSHPMALPSTCVFPLCAYPETLPLPCVSALFQISSARLSARSRTTSPPSRR